MLAKLDAHYQKFKNYKNKRTSVRRVPNSSLMSGFPPMKASFQKSKLPCGTLSCWPLEEDQREEKNLSCAVTREVFNNRLFPNQVLFFHHKNETKMWNAGIIPP